MTAPTPRWILVSITLRDFLGFQGEHSFEFARGLQVIEASNHTGKTSLAMGLLWGLTGQIPALARLNRQSYRLSNKHAGENAQASVTIALLDADGRRMAIRRPYQGRTRGGEDVVNLTLGDEELEGAEANARILLELGVGASSLEGCGVVLQDHRLKLITGSDIGEVINDMLGLDALSEVVPVLNDQSKEADQLRKEIEAFLTGGSPLARWQEESARLGLVLETCENVVLKAGYEPPALENPAELARTELASVVVQLGVEAPEGQTSISTEVNRLRKRLAALRKASPLIGDLATLSVARPPLESAAKNLRKLAKKWPPHDRLLTEESSRGELDLDAIGRTVGECDEALARNKSLAEETRGVQGLLEAAYAHLLRHPATDKCPLCESKIPGSDLSASIRGRLDAKLAGDLERLEGEDSALKAKKKRAEKRRTEVQELRTSHAGLVQESRNEFDRMVELGRKPQWAIDEANLFAESKARSKLVASIEASATELDARAEELRTQEADLQQKIEQQEEVQFQPLEVRLNLVRDALLPLVEAVQSIEDHGKLRDLAERRSSAMDDLLREARDTAGRLKKIATAVSDAETDRATAAIQARLPAVSEFFARVAENPDFTGLTVETSMSRNKVSYALRATSSRMAALGDAVGHVLSEGDMSAAGMALLLGLASGDQHRLGFLLLDDPAQGMDPTLQRNFARELANYPNRPQVIILTHQPDFAAALASNGAESRTLGRWEGGRLAGA